MIKEWDMDEQPKTAPDAPEQTAVTGSKNLDEVKRRALEALAPTLSSLEDMDPERKYSLCINALRATDNESLAEPALEAALQIADQSTKAEALIEIITEVNYLQQA